MNQQETAEAQAAQKPVDLVELIHAPEWKSMLLDLIRTEQMDPWDIDICALADKYLQKISTLSKLDLRFPANAILASAILLKLKARVLKLSSIEEEEDELRELTPEEKLMQRFIPELRTPRRMREGKISLEELVETIDAMLSKSKKTKSLFAKEIRPVEFAINYSDEETMAEKIDATYALIKDLADSQGLVLFSRLVSGKDAIGIIETFIPCLFLTNKNKINIWQEQFWQEIFIALNDADKIGGNKDAEKTS